MSYGVAGDNEGSQKDWKEVAIDMFYEYRKEAESAELRDLALLSAGKAVAISELMEKFGIMLDPKGRD